MTNTERYMNTVLMRPVPGAQLSTAWFTASSRFLESLLPYLSEDDKDKVCEELNARPHRQFH